MTSWLEVPDEHPFGLDHLPIASVVDSAGRRFAAVRIGDYALDLSFADAYAPLFAGGTLDAFLASGPQTWSGLRTYVTTRLSDPSWRSLVEPALVTLADVSAVLGFTVADFVDFYASEHHATTAGHIFRPDSEPLMPNWKYLPVGYHGRAGTVVVSGTPVARPSGQARAQNGAVGFGPSQRLDFEAEVAFVVGAASTPGVPIPVTDFAQYVFGVCLLNDWSARDIQSWENAPLGPFLGKSFATSVSGWITPLAALDSAWALPPPRDRPLQPYLDDKGLNTSLNLDLRVMLNGTVLAGPPFSAMYWTPAQMLAHLTVNGAHVRTGDLFASGTVSGPGARQRGSLLELTLDGTEPVTLSDGSERAFLQDGDEVVLTATAPGPHGALELGEVRGRIRSAVH